MRQQQDQVAARYQTGLRLRAFERCWETASGAQKQQVLPLVNKAVMGFFAGGAGASAQPLDDAVMRLLAPLPQAERWGLPLTVTPSSRFLDSAAGSVTLTVGELYKNPEKAPTKVAVFVTGNGGSSLRPTQNITKPLTSLPLTLTVPLPNAEGDATLLVEFNVGERGYAGLRHVPIALVKNRDQRLSALERSTEPSVQAIVGILTSLAAGASLETDYPAARLLADAEAMASGKPRWGAKQPGSFWLTLDVAGKRAPLRLLAPAASKTGKPLPLVIALHGAGGSENLFFDGYGNGKLVKRCEERGWLLVAPRNGAGTASPSALVQAVAALYPVDTTRVYLVGHSMGAMMSVAALNADPKAFAAAAMLGGGGMVKEASVLKDTPCFVGAGEADFGKSMAQGLATTLGVTLKVYPNCEHLTVVQDALDDVLAFFAKSQRGRS